MRIVRPPPYENFFMFLNCVSPNFPHFTCQKAPGSTHDPTKVPHTSQFTPFQGKLLRERKFTFVKAEGHLGLLGKNDLRKRGN